MQAEDAARGHAPSRALSGVPAHRAAEVAIAFAWPLAAMALLEQARPGMLASIAAFLLAPAVVLARVRPGIVLPALAFALVVGAPSIAWIDDLGTRNGQWRIVDPLPLR